MRELLDTLIRVQSAEHRFWTAYASSYAAFKALRKHRGISQQEIAARAKIAQGDVSLFENGITETLGRVKLLRLLTVYTQLEEGTYDNELERSA